MTNQSGFMKYKNVIILLATLVVAIIIGIFISSERLESFESTAQLQAADQRVVLNTIAETIARNGADSVTESIIQDCAVPDRIQFDSLLGQLDRGLSSLELNELNQLFGSCASFYADRKALMVARFEREIEVYEAQINLLNTLNTEDTYELSQVDRWKELFSQEQDQAEAFTSLVGLQRSIITALIDGQTPGSDEITAILSEVQETRESLVYARTKASEARSSLNPL